MIDAHPQHPDQILLVESGVWNLNPKRPMEERCHDLVNHVYQLCTKHGAKIVGVEAPFASRNIQVTIKLSRAGGAIYAGCGKAGAEVISITPMQAKIAVGCKGTKKFEVVSAVQHAFGNKLETDAADAVAVAIAVGHS